MANQPAVEQELATIAISPTEEDTVTLDELHSAYKHSLATWRTWERHHKVVQLVRLGEMSARATELGDPDLADSFDALGEVIEADIERPAVTL